MAALPPRRNPTPTKISKQHLTPLQILLQMGFPKHRAEKALAATGHRGVQLASDWLLAHVNDPLLDDNSPREYILYACPTGAFLDQLQQFWDKSLALCGWNGAHNFIPHITLVSFFKAPDEDALHLAQSLKAIMDSQGALLDEPLKLETYTSPNFMGFFVAEEHADYLKRIAMQYVKEVSNTIISDTYEQFDAITACFPWCTTTTARCIPRGSRSISLEPHVKSLHLTLAYQFPNVQYTNLKSLVDELDPSNSSGWELRLYSRDPRINGKQVHKVIHAYLPTESDELELRIGDYVYINSEILANSTDGWVDGISWLTGLTGYLPESYTKHTAESDAWTLHKKIQLNHLIIDNSKKTSRLLKMTDNDDDNNKKDVGGGGENNSSTNEKETVIVPSSSSSSTSSATNPRFVFVSQNEYNNEEEEEDGKAIDETNNKDIMLVKIENMYENVLKLKPTTKPLKCNNNQRKLFIMRHGERIDFTFGTWVPYCFDDCGNYIRKDLNMPETIPKRNLGPLGYTKDTPLTNIGVYQAKLIGEGLKHNNLTITHAYASPSFRCIQTLDALLKGLNKTNEIQIKIEPGLFEWVIWYPDDGLPDFLTNDELINAGYNIDLNYKSIIQINDLIELHENKSETCEKFYLRSKLITNEIINKQIDGNVIFVGHACTLEVCGRELINQQPKSVHEMIKIIKKVPYCSLLQLVEDNENNKWDIEDLPFPPVTHSANQRFDYKIFL